MFEDPLAAEDGAGAAGEGGGGEDGTEAEGAAADAVFEFDLAPFWAGDVRDVVVGGEFFVEEGVVAVEDVEEGTAAAEEVVGEAEGFVVEELAEVVIEFVAAAVGVGAGEDFFELEPLSGEVFGEGEGAGVGEHAAGLGFEDGGVEELAGFGGVEEGVVGEGAPEEEAEAGGEFGAGDGPGRGVAVGFGEEEEVWGAEGGFAGGAGSVFPGLAAGHAGCGELGVGVEGFGGGRGAEGEAEEGAEGLDEGWEWLEGIAGGRGEEARFEGGVGEGGGEGGVGGGEVLLGHDGGDEEGIGDVVEAFAASTFLGEKVGGEGFGDAEEVAEGGGVFGAIEAAEAAFAGVLDFAAAEEGFVFGDPGEEALFLILGGLVFFGGRHLAGEELVFGAPPEAEGGAGVGEVLEGGEVDAAFGGIGVVAVDAEGLEDGPDLVGPGGFGGAGGGGGEAQEGEAEGEAEEKAAKGGIWGDYV